MGTIIVLVALTWVGIWIFVGTVRIVFAACQGVHWGLTLSNAAIERRLVEAEISRTENISSGGIASALTLLLWLFIWFS
jgi:hypothetical protein